MNQPHYETTPPASTRQHDTNNWSHGDLAKLSGIIAALAHPLRLSIINMLSEGERSVGELCDQLWSSQPNISHHLSILQNRKLVSSRKESSRMLYALTDARLGTVAGMIPTRPAAKAIRPSHSVFL